MQTFALAFVLAVLPMPASSFDAGMLHVERFGNLHGRAVVLVPGLACGPWVWDVQIRALAPKYDVLAVSLPGFDGRPMVAGGDLMRRAAAALHELIVAQHLRRPIVVGHSLGGTLAVLFGETYPSDASAIVTVEGGYPVAPTQALRNADVAREIAPYVGIAQRALPAALRANMLQYTITRPSDVDRATRLAGRSQPEAIVAWMKAALVLDLTPKLSAIGVPFTAIVPFDPRIDPYAGYKTKAQKLAAYRSWVAHAPHGRVILIEGARHFVMIDRPRAFEDALENALMRN